MKSVKWWNMYKGLYYYVNSRKVKQWRVSRVLVQNEHSLPWFLQSLAVATRQQFSEPTSRYRLLSSNNKLELSNFRKIIRGLSVKDSFPPSPRRGLEMPLNPRVVLCSAFKKYRFFCCCFFFGWFLGMKRNKSPTQQKHFFLIL
jgi:hypothetical protein